MNDNYIESIEELRYYGSDLNKYIKKDKRFKRGNEGLVVNNIDLACYEWKLKRKRIVEYKHISEQMAGSQLSLLREFKKTTNVYIIYGNYPYIENFIIKDLALTNENIIYTIKKIYLNDFKSKIAINNDELVKFINFELQV